MHNLTITKSNYLVEASYKLTLEEQRLLLACIAQIKSEDTVPSEITIDVASYATIFNIQTKHAYDQLKAAANNLYERDIKLYDPKYKINNRLRWVYKIKYHIGEGKVTLAFSPDIKPYLSQLKEQFTSYKLHTVSNLKSIYSIRIYELLMQFKTTGERAINLNKLRNILELNDKQYIRFADIRRWIIKPAVNELNNKTDLAIEWQAIKKGRKVELITFSFKKAK